MASHRRVLAGTAALVALALISFAFGTVTNALVTPTSSPSVTAPGGNTVLLGSGMLDHIDMDVTTGLSRNLYDVGGCKQVRVALSWRGALSGSSSAKATLTILGDEPVSGTSFPVVSQSFEVSSPRAYSQIFSDLVVDEVSLRVQSHATLAAVHWALFCKPG